MPESHWFMSLADAREKLEDWRRYYNEDDPIAESARYPRFCCITPVPYPARHRRLKPKTPASGEGAFGSGAKPEQTLPINGGITGSRSISCARLPFSQG